MRGRITSLGEVATIDRKGVLPGEMPVDTAYIGLEHLSSSGNISSNETVASADLRSTKFRFSSQHVLFGKLRPYLCKIARPDFPGICSTDILPILPGEKLDRNYLYHFLRQPAQVELATVRSSGANLPRLSPGELAAFEIPLPPLAEQKRIAGILDAADALRAKRRESIAQLDALLQSTFLEMFGDPVTNPKGWEKVTVGDEISFMTSGSRGWARYYSDQGDLFIRIQNLVHGRLSLDEIAYVNAPNGAESKRTRVLPGDVLLSITADLGRTAVVPPDIPKGHINQHLAILRFRELDPTYVSYQLATPGGQVQFDKLNREGVKAGLNFNDIKSLTLTKPPQLAQRKFSKAVQSIEKLKVAHHSYLYELDTLFSSLQHRAFSGEL